MHPYRSTFKHGLVEMEVVDIEPNPGLAVTLGQTYMQRRCPIILGISPGNPYYYKTETLQHLLLLAESNSDKVLIFIADKISEHNYRAVGSKNPEKSARIKANRLRNKCKEAAGKVGLSDTKCNFVEWMEEIESSPEYARAFQIVTDLYQKNDKFRLGIQDSTETALKSMKNGRENSEVDGPTEHAINIGEGVKYLLKELAFFHAVPRIYDNCCNFVFVYHRSWPVLEKYFGGLYDNVVKPSLGFVIYSSVKF